MNTQAGWSNIMNNKISFIVWNGFQLNLFAPLLKIYKNSTLIVEERKKNKAQIVANAALEENLDINIIISSKIELLDGEYDVMICQTIFHGIENISKSKIVMLQYGYSKSSHNFGHWRALADLNLVFGSYAQERIQYLSAVNIIGHPKWERVKEGFYSKEIERHVFTEKNHKITISYLPTWGAGSTLFDILPVISKFSKKLNIIVKPHHLTQIFSEHLLRKAKENFSDITWVSSSEDSFFLLTASDYVLSDISGVIFDAILLKKIIFLIDSNSNSNSNSFEHLLRDKIGHRLKSKSDLEKILNEISNNEEFTFCDSKIREKLFSTEKNVYFEFKKSIDCLLEKEIKKTKKQLAIKKIQQTKLKIKKILINKIELIKSAIYNYIQRHL